LQKSVGSVATNKGRPDKHHGSAGRSTENNSAGHILTRQRKRREEENESRWMWRGKKANEERERERKRRD
jgi:hypothetical protein